MILKDSLFTVIDKHIETIRAEITVALNARHPIYAGHFPTDPITPGVCVTQIAVELCEMLFHQKLELTGAKSIKFLNLIRPSEHSQVTYELDWRLMEGSYLLKVVVRSADTIFAKCSLQLTIISE